MKKLVICILALMPLCSYAETHLILHIASDHSTDGYDSVDGSFKQYNEENWGLGIGYDITNHIQARAGFYDNSLGNTSVYVSGSLHTDISKPIAIGAQMGVVSGYQDEDVAERTTGLTVIALPFVQLRYKRVAVEVGYSPAIGKEKSLTTLSATLKL